MDTERLRSPQEVAAFTQTHVNTIYRAIRRGEIKAVKVGSRIRISDASLRQWLGTA